MYVMVTLSSSSPYKILYQFIKAAQVPVRGARLLKSQSGISLRDIHAVLMGRTEILIASIFPALNSSLIYSRKQYLFLCYHL